MVLATSKASNALHNAQGGVARHSTTNHACSSARNAAESVSVFHQVIMVIKVFALATTTGRPRKEDQNALEKQPVDENALKNLYYFLSVI
ncbi:GASA GAST Snakin [Olea europaea subsp. europaea]|uniref:GASA GAST Snakin n=1 Tax=Olea europaea subsp. europaea TaxID=158383 RepID=A0A8S0R677_OLEEU|nr:GASA GAST Snakin [Olea europaea subsp. europaea]